MKISNISKISAIVGGAFVAMPALAHPGHLDGAGHGHSHWFALAAVVGAVAVAVITWRRLAARSADATPRDRS